MKIFIGITKWSPS